MKNASNAIAAALAATLMSAAPTSVHAEGMGNNSAPQSLDSAAEFLQRMARDGFFGVKVYDNRARFLYHGSVFGMERPANCTLRFLLHKGGDPVAPTLTRTIDFTSRREVYDGNYNNMFRGVVVTGPVVLSDGTRQDGETFSIDAPDLRQMSVTAFQFFVDHCSTPYGFQN